MLHVKTQVEFLACACTYAFFLGFAPIGTPSLCLELFGMDNMVTMMGLLQVRNKDSASRKAIGDHVCSIHVLNHHFL